MPWLRCWLRSCYLFPLDFPEASHLLMLLLAVTGLLPAVLLAYAAGGVT